MSRATNAVARKRRKKKVLRQAKGPLQVSGLRYTIDWERFGKPGADRRAYPAGAIVTQVVDAQKTG